METKMLSSMSNKREEQLQNLTDFTDRIKNEIIGITSALNWTVKTIVNDNENYLVCPYEHSHRIAKKSLNRHLESCQWKTEGYGECDLPLSEPSVSADASSSIKIDARLQCEILRKAKEQDTSKKIENYECCTWHGLDLGLGERLIPRTSDRLLTDFTSDERTALYEYIVSNTVKADIGQDITDIHKPKSSDKKDKELSFLELLVQERNLKRRRAKHRGVHTNKKSHTEILREVINQQMDVYNDYMTQIHGVPRTADTSHSARIRESDTEPNEIIKNQYVSRKELSSKQFNTYAKDDHGSHSSKHVRNNEYERTLERHTGRKSGHQEFLKYTTSVKDSKKRHKKHSHRSRSRSKDRRSNKKSKHRFRKEDDNRKMHKSFGNEKSSEDSYSKRNIGRRKNRD